MPKKTAKTKNKTDKLGPIAPAQQASSQLTDREMFYIAIILVLIGIIIYFFIGGSFGAEKEKAMNEVKSGLGQKGGIPTLNNYFGSLPTLGDNSASVSLIEFGDYQCPFCAKFYKEAEQMIILKYVNTSKVKLYYRDLPQPELHDKAMLSSHAARCANEQNKFWEMHDKLYQSHNSWSILSVSSAKQRFQEYANELGLDTDEFNGCVNSEKYKNEIGADMQDAARLGISGTPTFALHIPKDKVELEDIQKVISIVRGTSFTQQGDNYIIIIVGARNYNDYKAFFDLVK